MPLCIAAFTLDISHMETMITLIYKNKDFSKNYSIEKPLFLTISKLSSGIEPPTSSLPRMRSTD